MTVPLAALLNGEPVADPARAVDLADRGLNYGDGLFETALLVNGTIRFLGAHLLRLRHGCERLGIAYAENEIAADARRLCESVSAGVLKIVVTRGAGGRGYRADPRAVSTRIVTVHPLPANSDRELTVRWCESRLARNAALAGIKHLNRLEQVLAQREWSDERIGEGLMLDTEGELVSGTASNVFIVRQGALLTPDLRFCGIRGVMRGEVLRAATEQGIACTEEPLWPHDLEEATEVFVTNAVRGIRSVVAIEERRWDIGPVTQQLVQALGL